MKSDDKIIPFSNFAAGFFLVNRSSTCGMFSYSMNDFTDKFNIYISDDCDEFSSFINLIYFTDKYISLKYDYDDIVNVDGYMSTTYNYLYSLTTVEVRNYFGIADRKKNRFSKIKTKVS